MSASRASTLTAADDGVLCVCVCVCVSRASILTTADDSILCVCVCVCKCVPKKQQRSEGVDKMKHTQGRGRQDQGVDKIKQTQRVDRSSAQYQARTGKGPG